jgi:hypothetical protein
MNVERALGDPRFSHHVVTVTDSTAWRANSALAAATSWARVLARFSRPISARRIGSMLAMRPRFEVQLLVKLTRTSRPETRGRRRRAETTAEPLHRDKQVEDFDPHPTKIADLSHRI